MDKAILAAVCPGQTKNGDDTVRMLSEAAKKLGRKSEGVTSAREAEKLGKQFMVLEVQYNPETLTIKEGGSLTFDLIFDATDGKDVQSTVKGFLGMLSSPVAKKVIFYWGSMNFPGEVTQMQASYDYFGPDGTPLRGKVSVTIQQNGSFGAHLNYWEKAYDAFPPKRKYTDGSD